MYRATPTSEPFSRGSIGDLYSPTTFSEPEKDDNLLVVGGVVAVLVVGGIGYAVYKGRKRKR